MNTRNIEDKLDELDNNGVFDSIAKMAANQATTFDFDDVKAVITKDSDFNGVDFNLVTVDFRVDNKSVASTYDIYVEDLKSELTDIMVNDNTYLLIDDGKGCLDTIVNEAKKANRHKVDLTIIND